MKWLMGKIFFHFTYAVYPMEWPEKRRYNYNAYNEGVRRWAYTKTV